MSESRRWNLFLLLWLCVPPLLLATRSSVAGTYGSVLPFSLEGGSDGGAVGYMDPACNQFLYASPGGHPGGTLVLLAGGRIEIHGTVTADAVHVVAPTSPTQEELDKWIAETTPKIKGKIVLVGRHTAVPVTITKSPLRRDDEQLRKQLDPSAPPLIPTLTNEHCQRWHYRCWADYMAAADWDDLRGTGFFYALELVKDKETKETFTDEECETLLRGFLSGALFDRGLICRADDRGDPVIQISPPLVARQAEFDEIVSVLGDVLTEAGRRVGLG